MPNNGVQALLEVDAHLPTSFCSRSNKISIVVIVDTMISNFDEEVGEILQAVLLSIFLFNDIICTPTDNSKVGLAGVATRTRIFSRVAFMRVT